MSYNILKLQTKYCFLNKEDQELKLLKEKRDPKDTTNIKKLNSIEKENLEYFQEIKDTKKTISNKQYNKINNMLQADLQTI